MTFLRNEEIENLVKPYSISLIRDFLNHFEYDYKNRDLLDFIFVDGEDEGKIGFKFWMSEGGEKGIFFLQTTHFLVFSTPERFMNDFNRYLNLLLFT